MLNFTKTPVKRVRVGRLHRGMIILYNRKLYLFDRIPKGGRSIYTVCMETMKQYKIRITKDNDTYYDVVGHREGGNLKPTQNDTNNLVKDDLFALDHNQKGSYIFRFERYTDKGIVATNPMNNREVRIAKYFVCTKIENLPF